MECKEIREYYCCYCNSYYNDDKWTQDHIIPVVLGGINSYKIISCAECNSRISREIEQVCAQSLDFRQAMIQLAKSGIRIKSRRKKEFIPYNKNLGISPEGYFKLGYNPITNKSVMKIYGKPTEINPYSISKDQKKKLFVIPLEEVSEREKIANSAMIYRIALASSYWYYGEIFSKESVSNELRRRMWSKNKDIILTPDSSPSVGIFKVMHRENICEHMIAKGKILKVAGRENLFNTITDCNNPPHHTIAISKLKQTMLFIVNFYGMFEYVI